MTGRIAIDWDRVKDELFSTERIPPAEDGSLKHVIHVHAGRSLSEARGLVKPQWLCETRRITPSGSAIAVEGGFKIAGERLSSYLRGADDAIFFLLTLGGGLEEAASCWMKSGEPLYGYLLDRIGSIAAESLAEAVEYSLRIEREKAGRSVSMRFSPGYSDWPVEEQHTLDKILGFSGIGVRLTEGCMMVPKKSVSGLVAVGPKDKFSGSRSQCETCGMKDCGYKR